MVSQVVFCIFSSKVGPSIIVMLSTVPTNTIKKGYFIVYHSSLQARTDFPAQLWKEYALSDSRYLSEDIFVLAIENITVVCAFSIQS